jgi:uncharacterized protein (TIGR03067 family)
MKRRILPILAGLLLAAWASYAEGPPASAGSDKEQLQGSWALFSIEVDGKVTPARDLKAGRLALDPRLVVKGERYTLYLGKSPVFMTYRLDPAHTPKQITLTIREGRAKGQTFQGVYRLEGDRFTICRPMNPGKERPTVLATRPGSGLILGVWKRAGP